MGFVEKEKGRGQYKIVGLGFAPLLGSSGFMGGLLPDRYECLTPVPDPTRFPTGLLLV
jgi:hypothetical protein